MEQTQEQINKSISAAFDSVNLINELNLIPVLSDDELATLNRNKEHISIMLGQDWFLNALSSQQLADLNAVL